MILHISGFWVNVITNFRIHFLNAVKVTKKYEQTFRMCQVGVRAKYQTTKTTKL